MAVKLGTENKTKTYAAIGLAIIAVLLAVHFIYDNFFSTPAPSPVVATAPSAVTARPAPPGAATSANAPSGLPATPFAHQAQAVPSSSALDPTLHPEWMAQAESTTYTGTGRNIFSPDSAPAVTHIEKPRVPIRPVAAVPQGPPPPPNIDLKFYGYTASNDGRKAFLLHGEDIFIAKEGDVVDRRYKVVKISAFSVDVNDIPYNHTQTLPLIQN